MLKSGFRDLYRESIASKALLTAGIIAGAVYVTALAMLVANWSSPSMPSIIAIYVAVAYGLAAFAIALPIVAVGFGLQEFLRRRRESKDNI